MPLAPTVLLGFRDKVGEQEEGDARTPLLGKACSPARGPGSVPQIKPDNLPLLLPPVSEIAKQPGCKTHIPGQKLCPSLSLRAPQAALAGASYFAPTPD
jgi:hypothetical protein